MKQQRLSTPTNPALFVLVSYTSDFRLMETDVSRKYILVYIWLRIQNENECYGWCRLSPQFACWRLDTNGGPVILYPKYQVTYIVDADTLFKGSVAGISSSRAFSRVSLCSFPTPP